MIRNKRLPSVMEHRFSEVPRATIPRSSFDRSCGLKTTFDAGYLVPVFTDEVLPGDTFSMKEAYLSRMATPIYPLMDNLRMESFYFFVPMRLIFSNWQRLCGEQKNPGDSTDFLVPVMTAPVGGYTAGSLSDYFSLPTKVASFTHISIYHRAYNLIWNEYYRDQNLQNSVVVDTDDGPDDPKDYVLLKRGKRHDYFTSCLPWPQKGPSVDLPIGSRAPIVGLGYDISGSGGIDKMSARNASTRLIGTKGLPFNTVPAGTAGIHTGGNPVYYSPSQPALLPNPGSSSNYYFDSNPEIYADLGGATASTINQLRQAFQMQRLYERDARSGTRYIEILKGHFGTTSPDSRLQRPEYLGGSSVAVNVSPIPQTSSSDTTSPQGNLAAYGTSASSKHVFTKSFVEHGVIIGMISVRADLNYQQGLDRRFSRRTRWDFYWPALSHIGEQAVLNKEIYCQGNAQDEAVFGYQERYAEYRYKSSCVTGQFRSNFAQSLDSWHLAQNFAALPTLNSTFIQENPPMSRILAVTGGYPHFILDAWFNLRCARPMPVYSVPGHMDHF